MLSFISFYSVKYYQLSINNINLCKKNDNYKNTNICIKAEFVQIVLPYFGILCGFIIFSYKTFYYILKLIHFILPNKIKINNNHKNNYKYKNNHKLKINHKHKYKNNYNKISPIILLNKTKTKNKTNGITKNKTNGISKSKTKSKTKGKTNKNDKYKINIKNINNPLSLIDFISSSSSPSPSPFLLLLLLFMTSYL